MPRPPRPLVPSPAAAALLAAAMLLGASCATGTDPGGGGGTGQPLRVDVRTDLLPGVEFAQVATFGDGSEALLLDVSFGDDFTTFRRVAVLRGGASRVRVELRGEDGAVVGQAETEVPPDRTSVRLTVLRRPGATCTGPVDCARAADCAPPRCEAGLCFYPPRHDRCDSGLCHPEEGCASDVPDEDGDGVPLTEDCDDADPAVGSTAERACDDERCGPGSGTRRCEGGSWGPCEASCACAAGETRTETCGNCGTRVDVCEGGEFTSGACVGEGPCAPGAIETGEACGRCGVRQRTCSATCGWSDWICAEPPSGCWLWRWDPAGGWRGYAMPEPSSPHAPASPVLAAFDMEAEAEVWLLTATTWHVLRLGDLSWVASGTLSDGTLPGFGGRPLGAFGVPSAPGGTDPEQAIVAVADGRAFVFLRQSGAWSLANTVNPVADDPAWSGPGAPRWADVRAGWIDRGNTHGWLTSVPSGCGAAVADADVQVIVAGSRAHLYVPGCGFVETPEPLATFGPFRSGAGPDPAAIAATFFRDATGHLWVVTP